jgi:ADP-heptose:LPS heptosyltransferase
MPWLKDIEVRVRGLAFHLVRPLLKRGRPGARIEPQSVARVLVIRKDKIGDAVCSLPVLAGLKRQLPDISLGVLCSPRNVGIFRDDPNLDQVFLYRKRIWRDIAEMRRIRKHRYDIVIDLIGDDSVTSLFLTQLASKTGLRLGVGKTRFKAYYDLAYDYLTEPNDHIIDMHLKVLSAFGIDPKAVSALVPIHMSRESHRKAEAFLAGVPSPRSGGLRIGYNLSVGKPERVWAEENISRLLSAMLKERPGSQLVLICTSGERALGERLVRELGDRASLVPKGLSMADVSAVVSRLDLLVTPDTSLVHVARSVGVPVVGLYPKWDAHRLALWRPYGQPTGVVMSKLDDNVFDITVEEVLVAFRDVVARAHAGGG